MRKLILVSILGLTLGAATLGATPAKAEYNSLPGTYSCTARGITFDSWPASWDMSQARANLFCAARAYGR